MMFARIQVGRYKDEKCKDPIDDDDVAFMYLVGYAAGNGADFTQSKDISMRVCHHFMRKGQMMGPFPFGHQIRLSLE